MNERLIAAAKELNGYTGDCRCHEGYTSRRLIDPDCCYHEVPNHEAAVDMLKAADAALFSDEAIERAENAVYSLAAINAPEVVRAVVAALKGDA